MTDGPTRHLTLTDPAGPAGPPPPDEPAYDPWDDRPTGGGTTQRAASADRTPPQDLAAEQSVLGAMLISARAIDDVEPTLDPADFYRPQHETIYDAILSLHSTGEPVDMVTVGSWLAARPGSRGRSQLEQVGGAPYLHTLASETPTAANATYYAEIVREKATLRRLVDAGTRIVQYGYTGQGEVDHLLESAQTELAKVTLGRPGATRVIGTGLIDLSWVADGQEPEQPQPIWVHRVDGTALFYAGKVNGVFGDPEHGKTWAAQIAVVEALKAGGTAAIIDVDHNGAAATASRLLLLGARLDQLADPDRFRYYEPQEGAELLNAVTDVTTRAGQGHCDVVVLDSLGEIFPMLGVGTNDGDEMTTAMRQVLTRPADAGACVITIDHLPKSVETRTTGFAIGSVAKKRMIRGAYLRAEAKIKPAPGQVGRIQLLIEKDTMGELRRSSGGGYAGTLVLDSTRPHTVAWSIGSEEPPKNTDGSYRYTNLMERVSGYVAENDGCSTRDIYSGVPGKERHIQDALAVLVSEGFITRVPGARRSWLHHSAIPYREAEDDHARPAPTGQLDV